MLKPGATIGIIGGGQLGRMIALAAIPMGYRVHVFCEEEECPAAEIATQLQVGRYQDAQALQQFAQACDVVTCEFENVPAEALELMEQSVAVHPSAAVLKTCRHRVTEKQAIQAAGFATAPFAPVTSLEELQQAAAQIGLPCVLKSCEMGYDGKGQVRIREESELTKAWETLATTDAVLEGWVAFQCEISVIVARQESGRSACFTPSMNRHENQMLDRSRVPAHLPEAVLQQAQALAMKLAAELRVVGLLTVELFVMPDGSLKVNELAPRPHNSGHWTMEAAATSQFQQLVRAITGQALGDTRLLSAAQMVNLIGEQVHHLDAYLANPQAHIHLYGKKEARAGRKMGHVTILEA